jgi:hypothetical protein
MTNYGSCFKVKDANGRLKGCSEDHEREISDLLENLIVFTTPETILIRPTIAKSATASLTFTRWASIPSRRASQLSGWQEFSRSKSLSNENSRIFSKP